MFLKPIVTQYITRTMKSVLCILLVAQWLNGFKVQASNPFLPDTTPNHMLAVSARGYLPTVMKNVSIPTSELKIVFVSERDGNPEIYIMNSNGTGQIRLTDNSASDLTPHWSPDGTQIAFVSGRDGSNDIFIINPDGSGVTNLTNNSASDNSFAWSPDGSKIAFVSNRDGYYSLYVMDVNGANVIRLTYNDPYSVSSTFSWSPDGVKLAFSYSSVDDPDIYSIHADGTGLMRLTNFIDTDEREWGIGPAWSPDGNRIAFSFCKPLMPLSAYNSPDIPPSNYSTIYVMNADGSEITPLRGSWGYKSAWSPDGKLIGFVEDPTIFSRAYLYIMNADGSNFTNLTPDDGPYWDSIEFAWSPGGDRIVYATAEFNAPISEIYLMNVDGSNKVALTNNPELDYSPAWQPQASTLP